MANIAITFYGTSESGYQSNLVCFKNNDNEIYIKISDINNDEFEFITLDKSTAIKLAKTLRTEINKMEDEANG